jgi:hypothetical protein
MFKKSFLPIFAVFALSCGVSFGQFTTIAPSDLGIGTNAGPVNGIFDISTLMGEAAGSVSIEVTNGFVAGTDVWTVSDSEFTTFDLTGTRDAIAFVNHGRNLGSPSFQPGTGLSRDGISTAPGEDWTLTSALDADFQSGFTANDYFVDYTGADDGVRHNNTVGFRWESDQAATNFSVFSSNSNLLDNNYTVGFRTVAAVPEPTAGLLIAFGGLLMLRRKRN